MMMVMVSLRVFSEAKPDCYKIKGGMKGVNPLANVGWSSIWIVSIDIAIGSVN